MDATPPRLSSGWLSMASRIRSNPVPFASKTSCPASRHTRRTASRCGPTGLFGGPMGPQPEPCGEVRSRRRRAATGRSPTRPAGPPARHATRRSLSQPPAPRAHPAGGGAPAPLRNPRGRLRGGCEGGPPSLDESPAYGSRLVRATDPREDASLDRTDQFHRFRRGLQRVDHLVGTQHVQWRRGDPPVASAVASAADEQPQNVGRAHDVPAFTRQVRADAVDVNVHGKQPSHGCHVYSPCWRSKQTSACMNGADALGPGKLCHWRESGPTCFFANLSRFRAGPRRVMSSMRAAHEGALCYPAGLERKSRSRPFA